jgi:hypothetical protein
MRNASIVEKTGMAGHNKNPYHVPFFHALQIAHMTCKVIGNSSGAVDFTVPFPGVAVDCCSLSDRESAELLRGPQ